MHEKFFNSVSAFEYYFYSHASTLSWMLFVPYLVFLANEQAVSAVLIAVLIYSYVRKKYGSLFSIDTQETEESVPVESDEAGRTARWHSFAVRSFLLAMLLLPAVVVMPNAALAATALQRHGLYFDDSLLAVGVIALVYSLSAVSVRIMGLVTRITSLPIVVFTLYITVIVLLAVAIGRMPPLDLSVTTVGEVGSLLTWVAFVYYILCAGLLARSLDQKKLPLDKFKRLRRLASSLSRAASLVILPLITFGIVAVYTIPAPDESIRITAGAIQDFTILEWHLREANPVLSLIFISLTIFLSQIFSALPEYIVKHSRVGLLAKFKTKYTSADSLTVARTLVGISAALFCFLNYNLLVVLGIVCLLLATGARFLPVAVAGSRPLSKRIIPLILTGLYLLMGFFVLARFPFYTFPLVIALLALTYYADHAFAYIQGRLTRLIDFCSSLVNRVKRRESLTIGQLVTTQTVVLFWIIVIFTITETVFSLQIEEFLQSYRTGVLLDLGLLLILLLYYVTVIVNTFLMVPKVEHYASVQTKLEKSNRQLAQDLAERKRMEADLRYTGSHDSLTETYNRDYILRQLERKLQRSTPFDIVFIDIDRFKRVNDMHGHVVGDRLLQDIAQYLRDTFGTKTAISRFGGDEFFLIVPGKSKKVLLSKCEQIANYFRNDYVQDDVEITATLRIGIYHYRGAEVSVGDVVRDIDFTVRYAKTEDEQSYAIYNEKIETIYKNRLELEEDIAVRVKNKDFTAFYQPVLDQEDDRIIGFEQLLRIHSEDRYWLPPAYIDIAEETGYIYEMGWIILEQACQKVRELSQAGYPDVYVAVNISPSQFVQTGFVQRLKRMCVEYDVQPKNLRLEIVENVMFDGSDGVRQIMNELTWSGYKLYLDDFGTGFSNMGYLKRLPIDTLKIDQSFIRTQDTAGKAVVRAMVSLSRDLSLNVIAEGVEEITHKEFLRSLGVRNLQGYYISKPMPGDQVLPFLRTFKGQDSLQKSN